MVYVAKQFVDASFDPVSASSKPSAFAAPSRRDHWHNVDEAHLLAQCKASVEGTFEVDDVYVITAIQSPPWSGFSGLPTLVELWTLLRAAPGARLDAI